MNVKKDGYGYGVFETTIFETRDVIFISERVRTVNQKKRGSLFLSITLANLSRFL